jgi:hypothetical protein
MNTTIIFMNTKYYECLGSDSALGNYKALQRFFLNDIEISTEIPFTKQSY